MIQKYTFEHFNSHQTQIIDLPLEWEFLSIQYQHGQPRLWVSALPHLATEPVHFFITGTGYEEHPRGEHLATVQHEGYVWHVFRIPS